MLNQLAKDLNGEEALIAIINKVYQIGIEQKLGFPPQNVKAFCGLYGHFKSAMRIFPHPPQ